MMTLTTPTIRAGSSAVLTVLTVLAVLAVTHLGVAAAQAPTAVLPPVSTELKRDSGTMPYARINELMRKLAEHGEGLVRMDWRVDRTKTKVPPESLRMAIASEEAYLPIKLDAEGRFALPLLPAEQAKTADFATNAPKGQLSVAGTLELTVAPEQLDMATVRRIMRVAHTLKTELLPWYLRWLFPGIEGVLVCGPEPKFELEWREAEPAGRLMGLTLPVGERDPERKPGQAPRACALMSGNESWPDSARLLAPAGSKLHVKLQGG